MNKTVAMPDLLEEVKSHFNEPVLIGFDLCRIIGYAEDEIDSCMIVLDPRGGIRWHTLVGGYAYLDSLAQESVVLPTYPAYPGEVWNSLSRLDSLLELNGAP